MKSGFELAAAAGKRWFGTCIVVAASVATLAACGGGGGGGGTTPPPTVPTSPAAPTANQITLQSEAGDVLGQGRSYTYTSANAEITVTVRAGLVSVVAVGDEDWQGDFQLPNGAMPQVRSYENALYYPADVTVQPAMRWFGGGRGCSTATGGFWIDHVGLTDDGFVRSLILRFERRCNGSAAALRGEVRWLATDTTAPPPVVDPAPATLWRPAAGATPATGNYVHLVSDAGDIIGMGRTRTYTTANAGLYGAGDLSYFDIQVHGEQSWYGIVWGRSGNVRNERLQRGYYADMTRYPFSNPTRGGLAWVGEGRGCADVRGWMVIDRIEFDPLGLRILAIEFRFEQRCVGSTGLLHGAVRWTKADADGPTTPSPVSAAGSWHPPAGSTPASGNYIYLDGEVGDSISAGSTYVMTPVDAVIGLQEADGRLVITASAQDRWFGYIRAAASGAPLRPGVYTDLPRSLNTNEDQPHFTVRGRGRGCEDSLAWLAVDEAVYVGGQLTSVRFRFEQRCSGAFGAPGIGALRGEVHWRADDLRVLLGPGSTAPAGFWRPAAGSTPTDPTVNYMHVESMRSDRVGAGLTTTYTQATAALNVNLTGNYLHIDVTGDETWYIDFKGIDGRERLEPGYYADLKDYPFHNPARGGMQIGSDGRGCNSVRAGFIIDSISYTPQGTLAALQMRYEQHCEGSTPGALWGEIRWAQGDTTAPPGPATPPAGLWQAEAGAVPTAGNYFYFQSLNGDFIGGGNQTRTLTPATSQFSLLQNTYGATATLKVDFGTPFSWLAEFKVMSSLTRLQPGYYGAISGHRFQNPTKGGLSFTGDGRSCNFIDGWFVVDSVTYSGDTITALKARFEQVCDGSGMLRGQLSWQQP